MGRTAPSPRAIIEYRIALSLLYLLLGSAANIAVAWCMAAAQAPPWLALVKPGEPDKAGEVERVSLWADGRPANAIAYDPLEHRSGWPLKSMSCRFPSRRDLTPGALALDGLSLPPRRFGSTLAPRALPMRPVWPAFLLNGCFYALLLCAPVACVVTRRGPRPVRVAAAVPVPPAAPAGQGVLTADMLPARPALPWYGG